MQNTIEPPVLDLDLEVRLTAAEDTEGTEGFGFGDTASSTSPNLTFGVQTMCPSCC